MKLNKIALSAVMAMSVFAGVPAVTSVSAAENYVYDGDLTENGTAVPEAWGVTPTPEQYRYQKEELAGFVHFGPNTFNNIEWGENYGDRAPDEIFTLENDFDAETLVKAFHDAGFKKIIVTAKHHDGFCIWASDYTEYDVASTSYKNGQGDILAEISEACTRYDMDMGLYLSPWDINAESYGYYDAEGRPTTAQGDVLDYNDYYVDQLNEILGDDKYGNDGHFTEIWMDGAKGSGSDAQDYDFQRWYDTIQAQEGLEAGYDSECMIFQCGANTTVRWIGNENGYAAKNTWSKSNVDVEADTCDDNLQGSYSLGYEDGNKWTVPEADSRITSGWFWGPNKSTPKSITDLGNMYFNSVGHNAPLLLNVPPNTDGTVDQEILDRLAEFGDNITATFANNLASGATIGATSVRGNDTAFKPSNVLDGNDDTYWTTDDGTAEGSLIIDLGSTKTFDVVSIEEAIQLGQSINEYKVEYRNGDDDEWTVLDEGETIGAKRLIRTASVRADQLRITVDTNKSDAVPMISEVGVYKASEDFELAGTAPVGMDVIDIEDTNISDGAGFTFTSGTWVAETGTNYINGTNRYANANASLTVTFHGSKIYLLGTRDPNHGTATIQIDDDDPVTIDTEASTRATGQMIFASDDLEDGDHTLTLTVGSTGAIGLEAAYVINNGGMGMIGLEQDSYTMNEDSSLEVKIVRVGGTAGTISALLQPNPGTAIQDDFDTEQISEIVMEEGQSEATATVTTRRNTNVTGDRQFTIELADPSDGLILGFNDRAQITIKDTETSSLETLDTLLETARGLKQDWYASGWEDFAQALAYAETIADAADPAAAEVTTAISGLRNAMEALVAREQYTESDRFQFPWREGSSAVLEAEFATELVNDESNDNGWPLEVAEGDWSSNGKFLNSLNTGDVAKYAYTAEKTGTYHVTAYYRSGSNTNALAWSEENGKIESGTVSAGAASTAATHTAEFDLVVNEAGDGMLVFTGPDGRSPQLDYLEIVPADIDVTEYTITASAGAGGTISDEGNATVEEGTDKTYTITADDGYAIADVLVNGTSVGACSTYTFENVSADATIEARFVFDHYTAANPFLFPSGSDSATLEAEYVSEIINDESNDNGWPCVVTEAAWASNGKFVDALNQGDVIKYNYRAAQAGTYHVVVTYRSGSNANALAWSEESGKIESGTVSAGANDSASATHTADFDLIVSEAGDGVLIFTGPDGKSPQLDKFEISFASAPQPEPADKTQLNEAIASADALDAADYTSTSWAALQEALNSAKRVAADEDADQDAVDAAVQALNAAVEALEEISEPSEPASAAAIQALQNMVEKANALGSDDAALQAAIEAAQAVLDEETPSATAVVTALLNLSEAMQAVNAGESVDALREDVQATIDFINENILNDTEGLRPAKVQALIDAVAAAQDAVDDPEADADQLKAANEAMTKAAQELWEIVTKAELEALIEAANGYLDGDYTAESLEALQAAITAAQAAANNDDATTAEITDAITNLANAIAGLENEAGVNKSALEYEIELVTQMIANLDDYVPSTVEGLADKLAAAQTVYDDANADQEAVDAAVSTLREARLSARTLADKSALDEALSLYSGYSANDYTAATWTAFYAAYQDAAAVYADAEATQKDVDAAVEALNTAAQALVEAPATQEPSADAQVTEKPSVSAGGVNADVSSTAAAMQTGLFAGIVVIAAIVVVALIVVRRRNKNKNA